MTEDKKDYSPEVGYTTKNDRIIENGNSGNPQTSEL